MAKEVFTEEQNEALRTELKAIIAEHERRASRRLTQAEVGALLGIAQQGAGYFLRGLHGASYASACRIASLRGFAGVDDLFRAHGVIGKRPSSKGLLAPWSALQAPSPVLADAAARMMARAHGYPPEFLDQWTHDDETDPELLWAMCKVTYASWKAARPAKRPAAAPSKRLQVERYMVLVDRVGHDLAEACRSDVDVTRSALDARLVAESQQRLPISAEHLVELSTHAKRASKALGAVDVSAPSVLEAVSRLCFLFDLTDRVSTNLGGLDLFFASRRSDSQQHDDVQ